MADETDKRLPHSHAHMTFMLLCQGQRGEGWGGTVTKGWVGTAIYCMDNLGQEQQAPL